MKLWSHLMGCVISGLLAAFLMEAAMSCTTQEKAIVRTVVDIAKQVCTEQDTLDACVDRILADRRVQAERAAHRR